MKIADYDADLHSDVSQVIAVGVFDGFHCGHQKIAQKVMELSGKSGLGTAAVILEPVSRDPGLLTTTQEKMLLLEKAGFSNTVVFRKGEKWQDWPAEKFVEDFIIKKMKARYVVVGSDFRFGKDRVGDISMLCRFRDIGLEPVEVPFMEYDGVKISSTYIRELISMGRLDEAKKMLGRNYCFSGNIIKGHGIGRKIGFPTLNFMIPEEKLLPRGVFYARIFSAASARPVAGACFIGNLSIKQIPGKHFRVEVHMLQYDKDIEKSITRVELISMLRRERSFSDMEELKKAIEKDVNTLRYNH